MIWRICRIAYPVQSLSAGVSLLLTVDQGFLGYWGKGVCLGYWLGQWGKGVLFFVWICLCHLDIYPRKNSPFIPMLISISRKNYFIASFQRKTASYWGFGGLFIYPRWSLTKDMVSGAGITPPVGSWSTLGFNGWLGAMDSFMHNRQCDGTLEPGYKLMGQLFYAHAVFVCGLKFNFDLYNVRIKKKQKKNGWAFITYLLPK